MAGWGETKTLNGGQDKPRLNDQMELLTFPDNKWVRVRFIGPIFSSASAFINVKKKDGTVNAKGFPVNCLDYDPKTQSYTKEICPWRGAGLRISQRFYSNVIVRSLQKKPPKDKSREESEKVRKNLLGEKWYLKEMGSETWTPVRVFSFPSSVLIKIKELMDLNEHDGETYPVNDIKYGFDVLIKKNSKATTPSDTWAVQKESCTPLKKEEMKYCLYQLDVSSLHPASLKEAKAEFGRLSSKIMVRGEDQKWHHLKKAKQAAEDNDVEDDDGDVKRRQFSLEDDDDDDESRAKKKPKTGKKKKPVNKKVSKKTNLSLDDDRPKNKKKRKPKPVEDDDEELPF